MGKLVHDDFLDGAFNILKNNANIMTACSAQPTTRAEAVTTYALADVTMASGDFTIANGDTNGRKVTIAQKTGVTVDANGTANHVALCDGTRLLLVTTCTAQVLTAGNTITFPAFDDEISDPT
jgi:hypothetical protein